MDLKATQLKDTFGNLLTIGTSAGTPTTGGLENGNGDNITALGIGTDTPTLGALEVRNNYIVQSDGTRNVYFGSDGTGGLVGTTTNHYLRFVTNNSERVRIDSSGNVGIGTSSPSSFFSNASQLVVGDGSTSRGITIFSAGSGDGQIFFADGTSGDERFRGVVRYEHSSDSMVVFTSGTERMRIDSSGNVGIGTTSPDTILDIDNDSAGMPSATWATTVANSTIRLSATGVPFYTHLMMGVGNATSSWIQSQHGNNNPQNLLLNPIGGNVGIGTDSPVNIASGYTNLTINGSGASNRGGVLSVSQADTEVGRLIVFNQELALYNQTSNPLIFGTGGSEKMRIDSSGNVGIGVSDVDSKLQVGASAESSIPSAGNKNNFLIVGNSASNSTNYGTMLGSLTSGNGYIQQQRFDGTATTYNLLLQPNGGNVGIGTDSPSAVGSRTTLNISGSAGSAIRLSDDTANAFLDYTDGSGVRLSVNASEPLTFQTSSTDRMTIDSSGNVLVAKDTIGLATVGCELRANGQITGTRDGSASLILNRTTSDGNIAQFYKDGSQVGSIGAISGDVAMYSTTADHNGLRFALDAILPTNNAGLVVDNDADLGSGSYRFKDLYLGGGVYLGGTGSDNFLDDYEEGTWTPVLRGSATAGTYETTTAEGYYTKVGNMVSLTARIFLAGSITGGGSGYAQITGAPFTKGANMAPQGSVKFSGVDLNNAGKYTNVEFISSSATSTLYFVSIADNATAIDENISAFSASDFFMFSITYFV